MWAHHRIFVSGNIFSLWSNYILCCFIVAENLPGHYADYRNPLNQISAQSNHFVSPASISIFCPNWHIAKQVLSRHLLFSSNFLCQLTYTNHCHIPIFSSICLLNLPQQISKVSIQREALWRKYKLGLSKWYNFFYSALLCPNYHTPQNYSSIHLSIWAQIQHPYFCPMWYFAKQVPSKLLHLSWKFAKTVSLVDDHTQPKLRPIGLVNFPYR